MTRQVVGHGLKKTLNKVSLEHKIKLKKRLAKAYKRMDEHVHQEDPEDIPRSPEPEMVERVQEALQVSAAQPRRPLVATKNPTPYHQNQHQYGSRHQSHKPDPLRAARDHQRRLQEEREAEHARRDAEIQAVQDRKEAAREERKVRFRRMTARTRKGQPVLSNQIDALLSKIQRTQ